MPLYFKFKYTPTLCLISVSPPSLPASTFRVLVHSRSFSMIFSDCFLFVGNPAQCVVYTQAPLFLTHFNLKHDLKS